MLVVWIGTPRLTSAAPYTSIATGATRRWDYGSGAIRRGGHLPRGLAGAAEGFGHSSIGGLNGNIYHVTSLAGEWPYVSLVILLVLYAESLHQ